MKTRWQMATAAVMAAAAVSGPAYAQGQTTTGSDTFDLLGTGFPDPTGGFVTRTITPDNSSKTGFGTNPSPNFGGSFFDLYGIGGRDPGGSNGEPFDIIDDSAGSFPPDNLGIIRSGAQDPGGVFIMADLVNGDNPSGLGLAQWTFDTSANPNWNIHRMKVDSAAMGDFETSDAVDFTASIGSTSAAPLLNVGMNAAQDAADTLYQITMQDGDQFDEYESPFFDTSNHSFLLSNGPGVNPGTGDTVDWHPVDNGVDPGDDGIAFNGIIAEPTLNDPSFKTLAYEETNSFGTFNEQEFEAFKDPLVANGIAGATQLDNVLQTITSNTINDTGGTLTIDMVASANGSVEYIVFDNISLESAVLGDANNDGSLTNGDIVGFADALTGTDQPGIDDDWVLDMNFDGSLTNGDIAGFVAALTGGSPLTAEQVAVFESTGLEVVPEPSALAMLGVLGGLATLRRRRA